MATQKKTHNTVKNIEIDLTKYSKVYKKIDDQWRVVGYCCRKCLSKFSTYVRLEKHPDKCPGAPNWMTRKE